MTTSWTSTTPSSQAAYQWEERDWFEATDAYGYGDDEHDHSQHDDSTLGVSKSEHLAHRLMRSAAPLLCAATLFGTPDRGFEPHTAAEGITVTPDHDPDATHHEREEVELSDPEVRVPREMPAQWGHADFGQRLRRVRQNPENGYLSGGESTVIYIADVSYEEFASLVEIYLACKQLPPKQESKYREFALKQKRAGDQRDVDILETLIAAVETPHD